MDHDSQLASAYSLTLVADSSPIDSLSHSASVRDLTSSPFSPETSPTRQQRLLQNRNARFPAKRLSISSISSKLTQFIGNNESTVEAGTRSRDQENIVPSGRIGGTLSRKGGLSILEEISNTAGKRSLRRKGDIHIYQDTPERPLLQSSPYVPSSPDLNLKHDLTSPLELGRVHDGLSEMRVRPSSTSERWSTLDSSPPQIRSSLRKRSGRTTYDQEEYIKHLEDRLHQLEQDAYSPLTRRPMKEKLKVAARENERLTKELNMLKEKFETEVRKTVEHKTAIEMDLRKRVRDLEVTLEEKEARVLEIQYRHAEERLDVSTIDSLKMTIERLEQEKLNMEQLHFSMNKRNETLTKLVVSGMSPPKMSSCFESASPVRERRNPRMSLVLPRMPTSPHERQHCLRSASTSPVLLSSRDVSPLRLSTDFGSQSLDIANQSYFEPYSATSLSNDGSLYSPAVSGLLSRRSTMFTELPSSTVVSSNTSTNIPNETRQPTRRKARRFLAGSTQLKPLLLPALTSEPSSSTSTPLMVASEIHPLETPYCTEPEQDADLTIIATDVTHELHSCDAHNDAQIDCSHSDMSHVEGDPGPAFPLDDEESVEDQHILFEEKDVSNSTMADIVMGTPPPAECYQTSDVSDRSTEARNLKCLEFELWSSLSNQDMNGDSPQSLAISSPTDRLAVIPLPLFSPVHFHPSESSTPSRTPSEDSEMQVKVRKRRELSTEDNKHVVRAGGTLLRVGNSPSKLSGGLVPNDGTSNTTLFDRPHNRIKSSDNFLDLLRQKNFAVKPLTIFTIRTVYKVLSACTSAVRDFQKNPFALARRVLANAWHMNWKVLGKLSWWVLGLFVHPDFQRRTQTAIDWDKYDGESIASRFCNSKRPNSTSDDVPACAERKCSTEPLRHVGSQTHVTGDEVKPGLLRSVLLWGKFTAAIMLAIGGAVIKGPSEMMKDLAADDDALVQGDQDTPNERSTRWRLVNDRNSFIKSQVTPLPCSRQRERVRHEQTADLNVKSGSQTASDPLLPLNPHDEMSRTSHDSIPSMQGRQLQLKENNYVFSVPEAIDFIPERSADPGLNVMATRNIEEKPPSTKQCQQTTKPFRLFDELSDSSCLY